MARRKDPATRAAELREQAKEVAGQSGEALKEFADATGTAAKEFGSRARDAAKDLVDAIEQAARHLDAPRSRTKRRRGRRFVRTALVLGVGIAIFTNERARETITGLVRRSRAGDEPEIWRPQTTTVGDGEVPAPASGQASV